jgi:HTH-type transcriptional regulator/antitoxin MqsA
MKDENVVCPFCDASPPMSTLARDRKMDFEGVTTIVHNLLYSKCGSCEMETVTPQQTRLNKRTIIEAHKSALGLLTAAEILELRHRLCITQIEAAQLFGGGINAFSKYENSTITQTKAMDNVLRLALEVPGAAEFLAIRENIELKKRIEKPISEEHSKVQSKLLVNSLVNRRRGNKITDNVVMQLQSSQKWLPYLSHLSMKSHPSIKLVHSCNNEEKLSHENIGEHHALISNVSRKKNKSHSCARRGIWPTTKQ